MQRVGVLGCAKLIQRCRFANQSRDACERFEVIAAGMFWCQQQEDQIHRRVIMTIKLDRLLQSGKQAENPIQILEFDMRDGNPASQTGRTEPLAL